MRKSSDELYHAWLRKGQKAKYIAKVPIGKGKYRYFYSKPEYMAYLAKKKVKSGLREAKESATEAFRKLAGLNTVKKFEKLEVTSIKDLDSAVTTAGEKFIKKYNTYHLTSDIVEEFKYIAKVVLSNGMTRYFYDQRSLDSFRKRQKYQENEPDFMKDVPKTKELMTRDQDMAEINEQYEEAVKNGDWKRTKNCVLCSVAYELRRRGYDVEAADSEKYTDPIQFKKEQGWYFGPHNAFKDPIIKKCDSSSELLSELSTQPNTRGMLNAIYKEGTSAHNVVYEVDDKGLVTLRDCQTNTVYSSTKDYFAGKIPRRDVNKFSGYSEVDQYLDWYDHGYQYTRTDNLELNKGVLDVIRNN